MFGIKLRCWGLEQQIHCWRAAGRPRDLEAIADLEALFDEIGKQDLPSS